MSKEENDFAKCRETLLPYLGSAMKDLRTRGYRIYSHYSLELREPKPIKKQYGPN